MYTLITKSEFVQNNFTGIIELAKGNKLWYKEGNLHREDGPAVEFQDGSKKWYIKGRLNREDGPAVEWADGSKFWYKEGRRYSKEEFNKLRLSAQSPCDGKVVEIDGKKYRLVSL